MRCRSRRLAIALSVLGTGGLLLAGPGTGCFSFAGESALRAADFCFIFNCQQGMLGGAVDPCAGVDTQNLEQIAEDANPLFTDCRQGEDGP